MAQTDRELLEAAAKAAGIRVHAAGQSARDGSGHGHVGLWTTTATRWNSLEDDGDALRLAADLHIDLYVRGEWAEAVAPMGAPQKVRYGMEGPRMAARRAITCAAAAMPPHRGLGAA